MFVRAERACEIVAAFISLYIIADVCICAINAAIYCIALVSSTWHLIYSHGHLYLTVLSATKHEPYLPIIPNCRTSHTHGTYQGGMARLS